MGQSASIILSAALMVPSGAAVAAETTFADDFSTPLGERWRAVSGEWEVREGRLVHPSAEGAPHDRLVADFPLREGVIQVDATAMAHNSYDFASVGFVGKHLDEQREWWLRYGSYGRINIDGRMPGMGKVHIGAVRPEPGRTYRLKLVIRNGLVGVCVDGSMIAIVEDPFADLAGRPGVFTETRAEFDNFSVTRTSR